MHPIVKESRTQSDSSIGRTKDGLYEPALADSEREAVADLLQYLENVGEIYPGILACRLTST